MTKGDILNVVIESIGLEGVAISRHEGMVIFIKNAIPGDTVKVKLHKVKKSYAEGRVLEIVEPSPRRVEPRCEHFGICGGCSWQNLNYADLLVYKKQNVDDSLTRIGKVEFGEMHDTAASPEIYNYRNKMEFSFGASRWLVGEEIESEDEIEDKHFALGLHIPGRYDKVLDVNRCHIQDERGNEILNVVKAKAKEFNANPYHPRVHKGCLRNLIIRKSLKRDELMVNLVINHPENDNDEAFLNWFRNDFQNEFPYIKEIYITLNSGRNPVPNNKPEKIKGEGYITEEVLGIEFRISPMSFFQTNSYQLDNFIGNIIDYAELTPDSVLWDLYCGTGSMSLPAAKRCKSVYGLELVESSINDAKTNAKLNNITNAQFFTSDLNAKQIPGILKSMKPSDTVILDPPRAGIHPNLINHLIDTLPKRIVYVSCNPATQARDLEKLDEHYHIREVQPFDMFPHTSHVETIVKLDRKIELWQKKS